jgi:protein ImuB
VIAGRDGRWRAVVAVDRAAQALGVRPGLALAQAQARVPDLHIEPADPAADATALARLVIWALRRYSPVVAIDLPGGLLIDATGVAHLFGGEAALLGELRARLTDRLESVNPGFDVEVMTLAAILAEPLA